jgi:hypothetical protein
MTDALTVSLDEALPVPATKVRLTIELLPAGGIRTHDEVIAAIRQRQRERGFQASSREAVDTGIEAERACWPE